MLIKNPTTYEPYIYYRNKLVQKPSIGVMKFSQGKNVCSFPYLGQIKTVFQGKTKFDGMYQFTAVNYRNIT